MKERERERERGLTFVSRIRRLEGKASRWCLLEVNNRCCLIIPALPVRQSLRTIRIPLRFDLSLVLSNGLASLLPLLYPWVNRWREKKKKKETKRREKSKREILGNGLVGFGKRKRKNGDEKNERNGNSWVEGKRLDYANPRAVTAGTRRVNGGK